jgi:type IV pilus assembly protein PilQ
MRRTIRWPAMAIVALMVAALGCAAAGSKSRPRQAAQGAGPSPAIVSESSSRSVGPRLTQAAFDEDADGARLVVSADAPLLYTAYEPRPDLLVVDLPGANLPPGFATPSAAGSLVTSVRFEPVAEMGKPLTRVSVEHRAGIRSEVRSVGQGLAISLEPSATAAAAQPPAEASAPAPAPSVVAEAPPPPVPAAVSPPPVVAEEISRQAPAAGEIAHALEEARVSVGPNGEVTVALLGDGTFAPRDFVLENPPRLVVDLPGVKNQVRRRVMPVKSSLVSRVRISQFQSAPDPVTRVVLDLARSLPHTLLADGERLSVVVAAGRGDNAPDTSPSRTTVAEPASTAADSGGARTSDTAPTATAPSSVPPAATVAVQDAPAPKEPPRAPAQASEPPNPAEAGPVSGVPSPVATVKKAVSAPPASEPLKLPPGVRKAERKNSPATQPAASHASPQRASSRENALFEAAAAMLAQEEPTPRAEAPQSYQPRAMAESQTQFTGEPISLDLKDADIKDVFRTISQLTQLNIVVDPEVRGTVTVQLEDVPWDQALDLILKQNGLGYVLENNIMRIATTTKLQAEQADRARLAEARQAAEPTRTVIKKLSYAKASEMTNTVKSVMSKRGDIVVDSRTNTMIIREIPTFLPAVLQLIENLDTPTPQVMIEARIVETTKSLGRSLGINWGANAVADVAHGNTTNLIFPNNVSGTFNVPLGVAQTVATVRLGNILDSFNLDVALSAAENQGLLKIISSPKVAALTNTAATIQSGVQIPVQTTVNNTTTVIYVDATLKLTVTPQITNEGTIMLNVNVAKREPAVALNLSTGQNVPLSIREYRGEILVRDGGTSVIGGIFQINDEDQNNMIPGLWKIPILGSLFRNKTRTEKHDELLIFITPRILRQ